MDDSINANFWHVPTNTMKKYASSFIGRPFIYHPSGDHPSYIKEGVVHDSPTLIDDILHIQNRYKAGDIIDITYEKNKDRPDTMGWYATIKVTNQDVYEKIKQGAISPYVSPQIYDLSKAEPGQPTTEFIPLHLAVVSEPAYGNIARIRASCSGTGSTCINALKSAALQVISAIDNSSFQKNFDNNTNRLTNPNYIDPNQTAGGQQQQQQQPQQQFIANQGYNPYQQVQDQNGQQFLSQKTQVQEVDANGNLITRTEDKKPRQVQNKPNIIANPESQAPPVAQQSPQPQPQQQSIPVAAAPVIDPNNSTPQLPTELLEQIKGLQAGLTGITERLNNVENFKKTSEDEKIKAASEAQRQIIESVFTPEVIQDENARQDVVNYFVGLPLADDDLKKILDMIVSGTFNSAGGPQNNNNSQASPRKAPPGGVKQASITNRLIMNPTQNFQNNYRGSAPISMAKRFFSDIAVENL